MGNEKGFTLIELILVVAILGMLAVAVAPQVGNVMANSQTRAAEGTAGQVRSGILTFYSNFLTQNGTPMWPPILDGSANGNCNVEGCFGGVLNAPLFSADWQRESNTNYRHIPTNRLYQYNSVNGEFR